MAKKIKKENTIDKYLIEFIDIKKRLMSEIASYFIGNKIVMPNEIITRYPLSSGTLFFLAKFDTIEGDENSFKLYRKEMPAWVSLEFDINKNTDVVCDVYSLTNILDSVSSYHEY